MAVVFIGIVAVAGVGKSRRGAPNALHGGVDGESVSGTGAASGWQRQGRCGVGMQFGCSATAEGHLHEHEISLNGPS